MTNEILEEAWKENHRRNKRGQDKRNKKRRKEKNKQYVFEYKCEHPCIKCGESDPYKLTFHHRNPDEKVSEIADLRCGESGIKLIKEIEKCDIVCLECHKKIHKISEKVKA